MFEKFCKVQLVCLLGFAGLVGCESMPGETIETIMLSEELLAEIIEPRTPVPEPGLFELPPEVLRCSRPDLFASLSVAQLSETTSCAGRVLFRGTVKNIGGLPFEAAPGEVVAVVRPSGASWSSAEMTIENLGVDEEMEVEFETDWTVGDEFSSDFEIVILIGPDFGRNPNNQDCVASNNRAELHREEISNQFVDCGA